MAWQIALVLATAYSRKDLDTLVRQMPIWAVRTPERQAAALDMRKGAGELWSPEAALTLFVPASTTDKIQVCRDVLGTIMEHHPHLAALELIGLATSPELTEILSEVGFEPAAGQFHEELAFRKPVDKLPKVRDLILDASVWKTADDIYDSFFEAVGAPAWHGRNCDAFKDSIVTGDINQVEVPYRLIIKDSARMALGAREGAEQFVALIRRFETEGCPVAIGME